ncbi:MAG TPA: DMT family transporter [Burkholderiaceae bacterium]|nr:DMT family transporter [Burkholderiaceae bacterium]
MEAETVSPAHSAGRRRLSGAFLVALSAAGFGAMPIFARQAYAAGVDLYGILLSRFALAGLLLALLAVLRGARMPPWRHVVMLALLGGVGYAGQSMLYYSALHYASAGLVALLLYAYPFSVISTLEPVVSVVLGALVLHEAVTIQRALGGAIVLAAVIWLALEPPRDA